MSEIIDSIEKYALNRDSRPKSIISKVGIVGCGMMGRTLARIISTQGFEVIFVEISEAKIEYVFERLNQEFEDIIQRWGMTASEKRAIMSRIKGTTQYADLAECDVVIEAVFSKTREKSVDIRKELFKQIEKYVKPETIIATNSTTLVITELSSELKKPDRCVSLHFIDSVQEVNVVEIAKGLHTSDEAFQKTKKFIQLLKRKEILVVESPGLISVRLTIPFINEACEILMEGVSTIEDIDTTMRMGFGLPYGPFEMADKIGIDKVLRWMDNLYNEFGDLKYKASPIIKKLVRANKLGRKTGTGFYDYHANGTKTVSKF